MSEEPGKTVYSCPMHPEVQQDRSGICPECGMKLAAAKPSDNENQASQKGGRIALIIGSTALFGILIYIFMPQTLPLLILLLCPLAHFFMMRGMHHGRHHD